MKNYEIMAIVKNSLDQKSAEAFCQTAIVEKIKTAGGKTTFEDFWGERGFAYKIDKMTWGYYFVARFDLDGAELKEIRSELNIENDLIRFMITAVDKNTTAPRKYADMKAEYEALEKERKEEKDAPAKKKDKVNAGGRESALGQNVKPAKLTTVKAEVKEAPKDALDKKLDDIVSESAQAL